MTSVLLGTPLTTEQREYVEIVRSSGETLLILLNDILDSSRIDAGQLDLELQPFDLRQCVEESLDLFTARAAEKDLELACLMHESAPTHIIGDSAR